MFFFSKNGLLGFGLILCLLQVKGQKVEWYQDKDTRLWGAQAADQEVVLPEFTSLNKLDEGIFLVKKKDKYGIYDEKGKIVLRCDYDEILLNRKKDLLVKQDNKWGVYSKKGKRLTPIRYDVIKEFINDKAVVYINGQFSFLNNNYAEVIPFRKGHLSTFNDDGMANFRIHDKVGKIDTAGKVIVPARYYSVRKFEGKFAKVELKNNKPYSNYRRIGLVNRKGKEVLPPIYNEIRFRPFGITATPTATKEKGYQEPVFFRVKGDSIHKSLYHYADSIGHGLFEVYEDYGTWKTCLLIDSNENVVIPKGKYDGFSPYNDSLILAFTDRWNDVSDIITIKGQIIKPDFGRVIYKNADILIVRKNKKYGVLNKNYHKILPYQYDNISPLHTDNSVSYYRLLIKPRDIEELRIASYEKEKYYLRGIINNQGKVIVPCKYQEIKELHNGAFAVRLDSLWKIIDNRGKDITSIEIKHIVAKTSNGMIVEKKEGWGVIDYQGKEIIPCKYDGIKWDIWGHRDIIQVILENKNGHFDTLGNEIVPPVFDQRTNGYRSWYSFNKHGLAKVWKNNKAGLINKKGKVILPIEYMAISYYHDGMAKVALNNKFGMVDTMGKIIVPCIYDKIYLFKGNCAKVMRNQKWGYVTNEGEEAIPCIYDDILPFKQQCAKALLNKNWIYIDRNGKEVTDCDYENSSYMDDLPVLGTKLQFIQSHFDQLLANHEKDKYLSSLYKSDYNKEGVVYLDDKFGIINLYDKLIVPLEYDKAYKFRNQQESYSFYYEKYSVKSPYCIMKQGKYGVVNYLGEVIIPLKYEKIHYNNYHYEVKLDGKWGVLDSLGNEVVSTKYDEIEYLDGNYILKQNEKYGIVDRNGFQKTPHIYDTIMYYHHPGSCTYSGYNSLFNPKGQVKVKVNGKIDYLDKDFTSLLSKKYDSVQFYYTNSSFLDLDNPLYHLATVKSEGEWGCVNADFEEVIPCLYDALKIDFILPVKQKGDTITNIVGIGAVKDGKWGVFDENGNEIIPVKQTVDAINVISAISTPDVFWQAPPGEMRYIIGKPIKSRMLVK